MGLRPTRVKQYLYLDIQGVSDLLSQLGETVPKEHRSIHKRSDSKATKKSVGLAATIWQIGFRGTRNHESAADQSHEEQMLVEHPPIEILTKVIDSLEEVDEIKLNQRSGDLAIANAESLPFFFTGNFAFTARHVASPKDIVNVINHHQMIDLELYQDDLRVSAWPHIRMGASLRKFVDCRKHGLIVDDDHVALRHTSHLAIYMCTATQKWIDLGVFGHISKVADDLYIKPYAIWLGGM